MKVSYIYGDEDSQHHKLPDYSLTKTPQLLANYTPQVRGLAPPSRPLAMQTLEEDEEHDDHHHHGMNQIQMAPLEDAQEEEEQWSQTLDFSEDNAKKQQRSAPPEDTPENVENGAPTKRGAVTPLHGAVHVASIHTHGARDPEAPASHSPREIFTQL